MMITEHMTDAFQQARRDVLVDYLVDHKGLTIRQARQTVAGLTAEEFDMYGDRIAEKMKKELKL